MENELEVNNLQDNTDEGSLAAVLHLSKDDIQRIMVSEFGEKITRSKGFDNLLNAFIH